MGVSRTSSPPYSQSTKCTLFGHVTPLVTTSRCAKVAFECERAEAASTHSSRISIRLHIIGKDEATSDCIDGLSVGAIKAKPIFVCGAVQHEHLLAVETSPQTGSRVWQSRSVGEVLPKSAVVGEARLR